MLITSNFTYAENTSVTFSLFDAAYSGDLEKARALILKGADVNWVTEGSGEIPIEWADINGHIELVKLLLEMV